MKATIKAKLRKNSFGTESTDYVPLLVSSGSVGVYEVINEMMTDGMNINREMAVQFINSFNQKAAEMVVSGYNVNLGLVNLRPHIKGSCTTPQLNPSVNTLEVLISKGFQLNKMLSDSEIVFETEIVEKSEMKTALNNPPLIENYCNVNDFIIKNP